ncbi:hypothetical protein O9K51_10504 [Purpureocillium lavendulum]|uniref:Secreted protein n=1 Tax=Purpureocillium lavendulum TaxID=1247861 RepID=A0AB34FEN5_9HYPO|nr:hypothetical protein O9K51_10504 [Purpureocillium lavendulum]
MQVGVLLLAEPWVSAFVVHVKDVAENRREREEVFKESSPTGKHRWTNTSHRHIVRRYRIEILPDNIRQRTLENWSQY